MTDAIILIAVAVAVQALRAYAEYLVTAGGTAMGWRRPSWYDVTRSDELRKAQGLPPLPGWKFWRDHWHTAQWVRNRLDSIGIVLAAIPAYCLTDEWWRWGLVAVSVAATWTAGHGLGFSLTNKLYNRR